MKKNQWIRRMTAFVLMAAMLSFGSSVGFAAVSPAPSVPRIENVRYQENAECVKISWKKVSAAARVQIYRAEDGSRNYRRIASRKGTASSYTDRNVQQGKSYRYKIRTVQTRKGKKQYSGFSKVKTVSVWDRNTVLDFESLLGTASAEHKRLQLQELPLAPFREYIVTGNQYRGLLTQDEITDLRNLSSETKEELSYAEAASDIELYFRTLRYAYGAYFYFGGEERFAQAEQEAMDAIKGKKTVAGTELQDALKRSVAFVRDGHFGVNGSSVDQPAVRYEYFYSDLYFSKDEKGYYKKIGDEKWYYASCTDPKARIEPTLTADGTVQYNLLLFCPITQMQQNDQVRLENGKKRKSLAVTWTQQEALRSSPSRKQEFILQKEGGIAYIAIRNFDLNADQQVYRAYQDSAREVQDCKLLIYDLRANGGGADHYARNWVKNFTGTEPRVNEVYANRKSALPENFHHVPIGAESFEYGKENGNFIANKIPVIVLMDDMCGSSGESALLFARCMDQVIVVGSNSGGDQICGNVSSYKLPQSGIPFSVPVSPNFKFDMNNVDGIGYEPDIWCNPKNALDAVFCLLVRSGYVDEAAVQKLKAKIDLSAEHEVSVVFDSCLVAEGDGFGSNNLDHDISILVDGKKTSAYQVRLEDPELASFRKNADGTLHLQKKKRGKCDLFIEYQGTEHRFLLFV